ncbi:hypothetical protein ACTHSZ_13385, partial [Neisseria sp. P0006.S006]
HGRLWSGLTNFHSWFVPVKLEVGIVGNLINCIFITFIAYEENIQVIYSEILLKSMFIFMSRSVSEFSGFDDRGNLRFYRRRIANKICLLFRQIYYNNLILKVK